MFHFHFFPLHWNCGYFPFKKNRLQKKLAKPSLWETGMFVRRVHARGDAKRSYCYTCKLNLLRRTLGFITCRCSWSCMCSEETSNLACLYPHRSRRVRLFVVGALHRLSDPPPDRSRTASHNCIWWEPSYLERREKNPTRCSSNLISVCIFYS